MPFIDPQEQHKEKLRQMEQRIHGLRQVHAGMQKLVLAAGNLCLAEKPKQLKALTAAQAKVVALRQLKVTGTARILDSCANEITSLREGLFAGTVSSRNKKELVLSTCSHSLTEVEALLARTEASRIRLASQDDEGNSVLAGEEEDQQLEEVIKRAGKLKDTLPKLQKGKLYTVGRAPVVVVTDPGGVQRRNKAASFVNISMLQRSGFKVDSMDGYAVLHDQMVIGVDKVKDNYPKGATPQAVAAAVAKRMAVAARKTYLFVLVKAYEYQGLVWFWVMPELELNQFSKAFPGGRIKLNTWGFAFNATNHAKPVPNLDTESVQVVHDTCAARAASAEKVGSHGDLTLMHLEEGTGGVYFLHSEESGEVPCFVRYRDCQVPPAFKKLLPGPNPKQVMVWSEPGFADHKLDESVFWKILLPKFHTLVSDFHQKPESKDFWVSAVRAAFNQHLKVHLLSTADRTSKSPENLAELQGLGNQVWGTSQWFKRIAVVITKG